jgi:hypothetical protein
MENLLTDVMKEVVQKHDFKGNIKTHIEQILSLINEGNKSDKYDTLQYYDKGKIKDDKIANEANASSIEYKGFTKFYDLIRVTPGK